MKVLKCNVCGATSDVKPDWHSWPQEKNEWRSITVRKRKGWRVEYVPAGGNAMKESADAWPGASYWEAPIVPLPDIVLDFCDNDCLEAGVRRLHKGCQLVGWSGTLPVAVFAVAKVAAEQDAAERGDGPAAVPAGPDSKSGSRPATGEAVPDESCGLPGAKGDGETWEAYAHRLETRIKQQRDQIKNLAELREVPGDIKARKRIASLERLLGKKELALSKQHDDLHAMKLKLEARIERLTEQLRISYPMTPVDCLISELRDEFYLGGLTRERFEERVAEADLAACAALADEEDSG